MVDSLILKGSTLTGEIEEVPPSIKNGRRILYVGAQGFKRPISARSQKAIAFYGRMRDLYFVAISEGKLDALAVPLEGRLSLDAVIYMDDQSKRDLDIESLKDALQAAGLVKNDFDFWRISMRREIDRFRPRVSFVVRVE